MSKTATEKLEDMPLSSQISLLNGKGKLKLAFILGGALGVPVAAATFEGIAPQFLDAVSMQNIRQISYPLLGAWFAPSFVMFGQSR